MKQSVLTSPYLDRLLAFERHILTHQTQIEAWFRTKWQKHRPPFYGSVDIRNAAYKISSVDMNLFPGGFNNLNTQFLQSEIIAAQDAMERSCPDAKSLLIVPENHTRNVFYLQNVFALAEIFRQAGFAVRLGTLNPEITVPTELKTADDDTILLEPLQRKGNRLTLADGFTPCVVLLNNDLSGGVPDILKNLEQKVLPPLNASWTTRRKTQHFAAFNRVADEFANLVGI
ncbi:MAG: glutamate--cysteine ligase, partial [Neisseriaceae bacterium]|nr:glutamate--cysteine ligase [Neisseriaceae bacterium]